MELWLQSIKLSCQTMKDMARIGEAQGFFFQSIREPPFNNMSPEWRTSCWRKEYLFLPDMFNKHLYCFYCKLKRWCLIVTLFVCIFAFALFWIWKIQVCHNRLKKEQNPSHSIITLFFSGNQGDVGPPGPSGPPGEQGPEGECGYTGRISMLDDRAYRILERAWATLILIASSIFVIK